MAELFGRERRNSLGLPLSEPSVREALLDDIAKALTPSFAAGPIVNGRAVNSMESDREKSDHQEYN